MATTYDDIQYCEVPEAGSAGGNWLLCIFTVTGVLLAIAGQQGLTISRSAETTEITSKTTDGNWKSYIAGAKEWSIDTDGAYVQSADSHKLLAKLFEDGDLVCVKVIDKKEKKALFGGLACITDYSLEAPYDDAVTFSLSLTGSGALVDLTIDTDMDDGNLNYKETIPLALVSLDITDGTLSPAFDANTYAYTVKADSDSGLFSVAAVAADTENRVMIIGGTSGSGSVYVDAKGKASTKNVGSSFRVIVYVDDGTFNIANETGTYVVYTFTVS